MGIVRWLTGQGGEPPDHAFSRSHLGRLHALLAPGHAGLMDEHTARDLLLDAYADRFAAGTSIFGRQMLHHRLRGGAQADVARVRALVDDPALRARVQELCRPLRHADVDISEHVFGAPPPAAPWWPRWLWVLPVALVASVALAFWWSLFWALFLSMALALTFGLIVIQAVWMTRATEWDTALLPLRTLLDVHRALGAETSPWLAAFAPGAPAAARLRPAFALALADTVSGSREYRDWFMQANVKRYFATRTALAANLRTVRDSLLLVAALEADCALATHLAGAPRFCWAQPAGGRELALDGVVHPLLDDAEPLSLALHGKGAFISGRNGTGKSTLLRTLGINMVTARAFGFCYASAARVPPLPVYASMQSEDALDGGESLYMAELRRARELTALAEQGPAVFIVDEIFRGTNHLESVSAATAVLNVLARDHLVIVSSHNLTLAPLLAGRLAPLCVEEGDDGRLRVRPGVLEKTNGIGLMAAYDFGADVERDALRVHDWLTRHARGEDAGPVPVLAEGA